MKVPRRQFLCLTGVVATVSTASRLAWAQTHPNHPIAVVFSLPADSLASIRAGLTVGDIEVRAQESNERDFVGRLTGINNQIDTGGTIGFKALFDNPSEILRPGQLVNVRLLGYSAIGKVYLK
ncbi:MAG TPA: hypothetical protein VIY51_00290 [Xanthobacteraceae bacterium]